MDIQSKFIYAKTRLAFERELLNIPANLDPIVFIEDTRELWTKNTYFNLGYPAIKISEISGTIKVEIGTENFVLQTTGASLSIRKGTGNNIIISSNALTSVNTEAPLEWQALDKKLVHKKSGVISGVYGQVSELSNASIFYIPKITVDAYGHIQSIVNSGVAIRDYVEQLAPETVAGDRNVLLSFREANDVSDTAQVKKAHGLTYNDATGLLNVKGGINAGGGVNINNGNLTVVGGYIVGTLQGSVEGQATPKIHLSDKPEYGGASLHLYGHVVLQDDLSTEPPDSSSNVDITSATVVRGVAATPKMVWNVKQQILSNLNNKPSIAGFIVGQDTIEITQPNQQISVRGENGVKVSIQDGGFVVKGTSFVGYDESNVEKSIENNIKFSKDFTFNGLNEVSLRWEEHN